MFTIGVDCGADLAPALVVLSAFVGYPCGDEGAPLDESRHRLARQAPAGLSGELRLSISTRRAASRR
jgi:hypothetical protein